MFSVGLLVGVVVGGGCVFGFGSCCWGDCCVLVFIVGVFGGVFGLVGLCSCFFWGLMGVFVVLGGEVKEVVIRLVFGIQIGVGLNAMVQIRRLLPQQGKQASNQRCLFCFNVEFFSPYPYRFV